MPPKRNEIGLRLLVDSTEPCFTTNIKCYQRHELTDKLPTDRSNKCQGFRFINWIVSRQAYSSSVFLVRILKIWTNIVQDFELLEWDYGNKFNLWPRRNWEEFTDSPKSSCAPTFKSLVRTPRIIPTNSVILRIYGYNRWNR